MINARRICLSIPLFPRVTIFRLCENLCSLLCKSPPLVIPTIVCISFFPSSPHPPHLLLPFYCARCRTSPPSKYACLSVCAPVRGQISLSSELQPGSLPPDADADESSSDMLVIVDDPVSSAPQSRATNSPSSVSGSVSDNMNGKQE